MSQMSIYFDKATSERFNKKASKYGLTRYAVISQLIAAFVNNPAAINFKPCYHVKVTEVEYKRTLKIIY